jgi:nucleotide-binding universal stress UspA family protein
MTPETTGRSADVRVSNVLVPLDGSEFALRAMPTARALARRLGAELHTISVVDADEHAEHLRSLASGALGVDTGDHRVGVVSGGEPSDAIARRARELDPSVVCLTTHGHGRLQGALVGSVARSLLQRSSDPLVALGPMADNPGWSPRPRRWPEPLSVPRIVACVDGTDPSEQVLPLAAAWARALNMRLTILTVIDDAPRSDDSGGDPPSVNPERYIDDLVQQWRKEVSDADGVVLRDPIGPASAIRVHLDQQPAGLVALTTHARSGMQRALLGAVAASILNASVVPCVVAQARA